MTNILYLLVNFVINSITNKRTTFIYTFATYPQFFRLHASYFYLIKNIPKDIKAMKQLIKPYFKTLSVISPNLASKRAFNMFQKVRKKDIRDREKPFYTEANQYTIPFGNEFIHCYSFGDEKNDIVVLVHGWDSNAGCMYKFITPLLNQNKHVVSFNLPGHAFYAESRTHLYESKEVFKTFINSLPKGRNISIISHSFGSAVTGFGLSELDLSIDKLIFLTSPNKILDIFKDYQKLIGLGNRTFQKLKDRASNTLGEPIEQVNVEKRMKLAKFNHLYLLHDRADKVIPYKYSEDIHQVVSNSTLISYNNIGHYRMLWNDELIKEVMSIISS